ncbi:hypothetical protein J0H58_06520 [bacterium]|nr:hypothetical protein [bacterium]
MDPTPEELAYITAHGLAVDYGFRQHDLGDQLVAFVWAFRRDGVCRGSIWLGPPASIPPEVPPVTEPEWRVRELRYGHDLAPDAPVFLTVEPRLRMWVAGGSWFVDDSRCPCGGRRHHTFRWQFPTLPEAIRAVVGYLREKCGEIGSATADA